MSEPNLLEEANEGTGLTMLDAIEAPEPEVEPEVEQEAVPEPEPEPDEVEPEPEPDEVEPEPEPDEDDGEPLELDDDEAAGDHDALIARLIEAEAESEDVKKVFDSVATAPTLDPENVEFDLSDDDFDRMVTDKDSAIDVFKRVTANTVNHVLKGLVPMIHHQFSNRMVNYELLRQFTAEYPLFQKNPAALEAAINNVRNKYPDELDGRRVVQLLKEEVEARFKKYRELKENVASAKSKGKKVDVRSKRGRFAPGTNARNKVSLTQAKTSREKALRELEQSFGGKTLLDDFEVE